MTLKNIASVLFITLLLAACASTNPPATTVPTNSSAVPATTGTPFLYPAPVVETPITNSTAYPAPGTPAQGSSNNPTTGYDPKPGDENLKRDEVSLDLTNSQITVSTSQPIQATAVLKGNMSDPCHQLRVVMSPPDSHNSIFVEVYSLVDSSKACTTVISPFTANIPLGTYSGAHYSVYVNGQLLGGFNG